MQLIEPIPQAPVWLNGYRHGDRLIQYVDRWWGGAATGGRGEASEKHEGKNTQSDGQGVTRCT